MIERFSMKRVVRDLADQGHPQKTIAVMTRLGDSRVSKLLKDPEYDPDMRLDTLYDAANGLGITLEELLHWGSRQAEAPTTIGLPNIYTRQVTKLSPQYA